MKSEFVDGLLMRRRGALKTLAGLSMTGLAFGGVGSRVFGQEDIPRYVPNVASAFDYKNPYDNAYAFGKIWAGYDEPQYGAYHGVMYGRAGGKRHEALFGYIGSGVMQSRIEDSGNVSIRGKETGFFYDLATNDIIEEWRNPYTGELVRPFNFLNEIGATLTAEMPRFAFGSDEDEPTLVNEGTHQEENGKVPFILPFESYGDDLLLAWDYAHGYQNPVTKEKWPKASTGEKISPSEHFTFRVSKSELEDKSIPSSRFIAGFSRVSEWWPWMRMGGHQYQNGIIFGRMFSHKGLPDYQDLPPKLLTYIEKHHPEFLEVPGNWVEKKAVGTWEKYAAEVAPE